MDVDFNDSIVLDGINIADINSTNTDLKIIPYIDKISSENINQSLFALTW